MCNYFENHIPSDDFRNQIHNLKWNPFGIQYVKRKLTLIELRTAYHAQHLGHIDTHVVPKEHMFHILNAERFVYNLVYSEVL